MISLVLASVLGRRREADGFVPIVVVLVVAVVVIVVLFAFCAALGDGADG